MASMLHACPYCGYETEIVNVLPAFSENPHCQRCGLSVTEGDSKVDNDLSSLFARQMTMNHRPQGLTPICPATPPTPRFSNPSTVPDGPPIAYSITQHYHHSSHQARMGLQKSDSDIAGPLEQQKPPAGRYMSSREMLLRHNINPDTLFPSQLALFEQADREQKARLVELWQISPPTFGNPSSLQPFANNLPALSTHGAECSQLDSFGKALDPHNDVMMDEDSTNSCDTHAAEPYVVSGYEMLAQREYNLPTQPSLPFPQGNSPAEIPSSATYNPSTDPVYKREDRQETQPIEHQYGAFEMKNYYIGCGVARAHWLEDQHFF
ncbi:hypothetical protein CPC735_000700 [Coccidioides posadasii C735 delta SOWgp]|uniref:Uncharacterized protein n=1 Tax=Coccidioides posadasii (strain C735) TaxID=222929 RepID=C5PE98_COCP7|nr:hypothetical protein CPC735_000700 [Coccidioides posadasii C735 delta SOWgp]EER24726.1 hypothetical protein CPC735_000700 [Coccidioides posadasii C735 delta SOWgp]|eukprot:XP_003066871.1 hypothetical protein CPC735_000700 [Coccidioides posadasii C735 delta SOWgp]